MVKRLVGFVSLSAQLTVDISYRYYHLSVGAMDWLVLDRCEAKPVVGKDSCPGLIVSLLCTINL